MSNHLRNSLVLGVVLIVLIVCGWGYLHYFKGSKISDLQSELTHKKKTLREMKNKASHYDALYAAYKKARHYFKHYPKTLYPNSDQTVVYDFLERLNHGPARNDFNFSFSDSVTHDKYGVLIMKIKGTGLYDHVINFIRGIELSKPLNKISNLSISPVSGMINHDSVSYQFKLKSFYDRTKLLGKPSLAIQYKALSSVNNPFYPIVHSITPNKNDRINVEQSKLLSVTGGMVFLIDQNGALRHVRIGGRVYLGKLTRINLSSGKATFTLNKGGIIKTVTLTIHHEQNK